MYEKEWFTDKIEQLFEKRRLPKNVEEKEYVQKIVRKKIQEAKEKLIKDECTEIEKLQQQHDDFKLY